MSLSHLYTQAYFVANDYGNDRKRAQMQLQEARRVRDRMPATGSVLDIGCGIGDFLANHFSGWHKYGVEISEWASEQARSRGVTVKPYAYKYDYPDESFDLVIFRGTIQHLDEPFDALRIAYDLLRFGGMVAFLATPNAGSLVYRLWQDLPALDDRRNFWVPSAKTLSNALRNIGFDDIETLYPYRGTPYAEPWKNGRDFLLRCLGVKRRFAFPKNMMEVYGWKR